MTSVDRLDITSEQRTLNRHLEILILCVSLKKTNVFASYFSNISEILVAKKYDLFEYLNRINILAISKFRNDSYDFKKYLSENVISLIIIIICRIINFLFAEQIVNHLT